MGIAIVPIYPQERRALFNDWQDQATTEMTTVEKWMTEGYILKDKTTGADKLHVVDEDHNWVCVSKFESVGCNDIDDLEACKKLGMPALPEGFTVDTPSGGLHVPFVHDDRTRKLGKQRNVLVNGKKVFEFKGHSQPWCAPWQWRADGGYYKPRDGNHTCKTRYMDREKIEATLDALLGEHLIRPSFLERCVDELTRRSKSDDSANRTERLTSVLASSQRKRQRIIDSFVDGVLSLEERNERLAIIDQEIQEALEMLNREKPSVPIDLGALTKALAPLAEWRYWSRDEKRKLLAALMPEIRVADYEVESLGLNPAIFSNEDTHMDTDS